MNLYVVDVETDSVKPELANILEIGLASVNIGSGETELIFDTLVCPEQMPGMETWLNCWFLEHSGVSPDEIRSAPKFADLKLGIQGWLTLAPVTAYNLHFDLQILARHGVNPKRTWPCLMQTAKYALKMPGEYRDYKYPSFAEAWRYFLPDEPFEERHRAGHDALHEAKLAFKIHQRGLFHRRTN